MTARKAEQPKEEVKKEAKEKVKEEVKETDVAVKEETAPANVSTDEEVIDLSQYGFDEDTLSELSGLDTMNPNDIRVPYAKLYKKPDANRDVGDLELPDGTIIKGKDGEVLAELSILKQQPVRVMFPEKFNRNNSFICRSLDGIKGAPDGAYPGRLCSECEYSKFPEDGGSSPCSDQRLLLCTVPDSTPFHILVSGISMSPFKKFQSVEMMYGTGKAKKKFKTKTNLLGALKLALHIEIENTDNGTFPKLVFKLDKNDPLVSTPRLLANLEAYSNYKDYEQEATESAAMFSQQHGSDDEGEEGPNNEMF